MKNHKPTTTLHLLRLAALAALYFLAGQASFMVSVSHGIVTLVVFAAEGFSLAAVLIYGPRMWPGIFIGQLALALYNGLPPGAALAISVINSAEAVVGWAAFRHLRLRHDLGRLRDVLGLIALVFLINQPFSASLGVGTLVLAGIVPAQELSVAWFSWWFGNGLGQLLVTPLLLALTAKPAPAGTPRVLALIGLLLTPFCWLFFSRFYLEGAALPFALFAPILVLASVLSGMAAAMLSTVIVAATALIATSLGLGPFVSGPSPRLTDLNLFLTGGAFISLFIAALFEERRRAKEELQHYVDVVDRHVITSSTDRNGTITGASEAFCRISGYAREELIGQPHRIVRHPDMPRSLYRGLWETITRGEVWEGEIKNRRKDGSHYWVDVHIEPNHDEAGEIIGYTAIRQDITERKRAEHLAITDRLTQLFNRLKLDEELEREVARAERYGSPLSVVLFDIDHFKSVNDTHGHQVGDQVLMQIADLVRANARTSDIAGRWGGEEFLLVCPETDEAGVAAVAEKLRAAIAGHDFPSVGAKSSSFGVATRHPGESEDELVGRADEALYRAKAGGRNRVEAASPSVPPRPPSPH